MSEKFYVTTSIAYVNGEPHLGHAQEFVIADSIARIHKQRGERVLYATGTDEHGTKIAEKAEGLGLNPKQFADKNSQKFRDIQTSLGSEPDRFVRTTDDYHEAAVQYVWQELQKRDLIYKSSYKGWYCTGCESFVTETEVKANHGVCPDHQKPYQELNEENYFYKLSQFSDPIRQAIENDELKIIPKSRKNEILNVLKEGLSDISISRPKEKLTWGIDVPGDDSQVVYVWFDALLNYISVIDYPKLGDFADFWPANVQVIGKDILRFHAATWPGILLGLGLPLPKQILVHGFITMSGEKMSKSLGNVIAPQDIIDRYGQDAFRYYFLRHIPTTGDGDFTWHKFEQAYNNELGNELGNLVQRVASMSLRYQQGVIGEIVNNTHDVTAFSDAVDDLRFDKALDEVWEMVKNTNRYLEVTKPWELASRGDSEHLQKVLATAAGDILQIADLLTPFLPKVANTILQIFNNGIVREYKGVLFPRIEIMASDKSA